VLRAELEARHAALNLQGRVRFACAQEQERVRVAWQGADLAVLTSENEGMPVSLMEAAACGVPAVAPAVGGIPELVEDGVTGVLVRAGGATEFTDALQTPARGSRPARQDGGIAARPPRGGAFLPRATGGRVARVVEGGAGMSTPPERVTVSDPFGARQDPALPTVGPALDPAAVAEAFKRACPGWRARAAASR
jgi:hypothetical protein